MNLVGSWNNVQILSEELNLETFRLLVSSVFLPPSNNKTSVNITHTRTDVWSHTLSQSSGLSVRYVPLNTVICLPGVVRHQFPAMCCREETPAPEQKIYSSITIRPDTNILPLHFHTARRIIPLTENKCVIRGSSSWSFKVSAHFYSRVVSAPTPRSPAALAPKRPCFLQFPVGTLRTMWLTQQVQLQSHREMNNLSHLVS